MCNTVYLLFSKGMIEDYYPTQTLIGIYSSKEEAEKALATIEVKHKANSLNRYIDYTNSKENTREFWELKKHQAEQSLARKQEGSNGWRKEKHSYDQICKTLDTRDFDKFDTFDEWKAKHSWLNNFNRNVYKILESKMNSFVEDSCE